MYVLVSIEISLHPVYNIKLWDLVPPIYITLLYCPVLFCIHTYTHTLSLSLKELVISTQQEDNGFDDFQSYVKYITHKAGFLIAIHHLLQNQSNYVLLLCSVSDGRENCLNARVII
jgi:hypothetical protein